MMHKDKYQNVNGVKWIIQRCTDKVPNRNAPMKVHISFTKTFFILYTRTLNNNKFSLLLYMQVLLCASSFLSFFLLSNETASTLPSKKKMVTIIKNYSWPFSIKILFVSRFQDVVNKRNKTETNQKFRK